MRRISWMVFLMAGALWAQTEIPESARKLFERGNEFVKKASLPRAKVEYLKALKAHPPFKDALYNLAVVCEQLGQPDEAVTYYRQYLELSPTSADVWTQLGVLCDTTGRKAEAEAAYRKALEGNPKFGRAHHNLGVLLEEQKQYAEARTHLENFVKLEEAAGRKNGDAYFSLGVFHLHRGRVREAKMLLQKSLDIDPTVVHYNNAMGDVYLAEKNPEVAAIHYRKAIEKDAKFALAYSGLGDTCRQLGQVESASENYRKALELRADYDVVHYKLGLLYEEKQPAEAIKHFEKYLQSGTNLQYQDEVQSKLTVLKQFHGNQQP